MTNSPGQVNCPETLGSDTVDVSMAWTFFSFLSIFNIQPRWYSVTQLWFPSCDDHAISQQYGQNQTLVLSLFPHSVCVVERLNFSTYAWLAEGLYIVYVIQSDYWQITKRRGKDMYCRCQKKQSIWLGSTHTTVFNFFTFREFKDLRNGSDIGDTNYFVKYYFRHHRWGRGPNRRSKSRKSPQISNTRLFLLYGWARFLPARLHP